MLFRSNENEPHGLKELHSKYISNKIEQSFSKLFKKVKFNLIPIEFAYLYASNDAIDTYDLFEYQLKILSAPGNEDLLWLYQNIEIPMIDVIVDLQDTGIYVDVEYLDTLKEKYHNNLDTALEKCNIEIEKYRKEIDLYNAKNINKPLPNPININSSEQLAILFYQILKLPSIKGKSSTGTDADIMKIFSKKHNIAKYILEFRAAQKITSTYIDNIYNFIHTDNRVHTHFKTMGAVTGRMSSSDPLNLQNIPSHNEDIRKMFSGQTTIRHVESRPDNSYIFNRCEEIELIDDTWKWVELIKVGDTLKNGEIVKAVIVKQFKVLIGV